jgi:hypothetical protein
MPLSHHRGRGHFRSHPVGLAQEIKINPNYDIKMKPRQYDSGPPRLLPLLFGILGALFLARTIHYGKFDAGGHKYAAIVNQSQDPHLFWGVVVLVALLTAAAFYCAFARGRI